MKLYKTFNRIDGQLTSWNCYNASIEENKRKAGWKFMVYSETERNFAPRMNGIRTKLFCYTEPLILCSTFHVSELWEVDARGVEELTFSLTTDSELKGWKERRPRQVNDFNILEEYPYTILASSVKLIRKIDEHVGMYVRLSKHT